MRATRGASSPAQQGVDARTHGQHTAKVGHGGRLRAGGSGHGIGQGMMRVGVRAFLDDLREVGLVKNGSWRPNLGREERRPWRSSTSRASSTAAPGPIHCAGRRRGTRRSSWTCSYGWIWTPAAVSNGVVDRSSQALSGDCSRDSSNDSYGRRLHPLRRTTPSLPPRPSHAGACSSPATATSRAAKPRRDHVRTGVDPDIGSKWPTCQGEREGDVMREGDLFLLVGSTCKLDREFFSFS